MRILNIIMAALFVFGAVVQYNDPDPAAWMSIYLAAAAACILAVRGTNILWLPAVLLVACIVWALSLTPAVVGRIPFLEMFSAWEMKNVAVEKSREMYGLLVIGTWMLVLTISAVRERRRPPSA
ncbi:MAG: hypothetical protein HKN13_14250 [Rhodothermales bacterium]|nr:hypothetical protein [Rhodothermales bacterium]